MLACPVKDINRKSIVEVKSFTLLLPGHTSVVVIADDAGHGARNQMLLLEHVLLIQ